MTYRIIENEISPGGDKRILRVEISPEETIYLNLDIDPSQERVDAEVEVFLANRNLSAAQDRLNVAQVALQNLK